MHKLYELAESLCEDIVELGKKDRTPQTASMLKDLTKATKNIGDIITQKLEMEEYSHGNGYSMTAGGGYSVADRGGSYGDGMRGGVSHARGRGRNAARDSMGRYSSAQYSREGGYSQSDGRESIEQLNMMLGEAKSPAARRALAEALRMMEGDQ